MTNKKQNFTSSALNKLVDESIAEADGFEKELESIDASQLEIRNADNIEEFDDYQTESDKNWSEENNVINKEDGSSISFNYVYKKISNLIDTGNAALQMLQTIDIDGGDPSMVRSTASLMEAIRGCIAEFTKIHQQWIRYNQTVKLENLKFENKKKLLKFRNEVNNKDENAAVTSNSLIEVKSSELIAFLQWKKQQEELEKEKNNKI